MEAMTLGTLHDARLRVVEPFELAPYVREASHQRKVVLIEAPEIGQFGMGATDTEALQDLQATIVELYFTLNEEARLGPQMQATLTTLQRKIQRVEPIRQPRNLSA